MEEVLFQILKKLVFIWNEFLETIREISKMFAFFFDNPRIPFDKFAIILSILTSYSFLLKIKIVHVFGGFLKIKNSFEAVAL